MEIRLKSYYRNETARLFTSTESVRFKISNILPL